MLATGLEENRSLQQVAPSHNQIKDGSTLAAALKRNASLQQVFLLRKQFKDVSP